MIRALIRASDSLAVRTAVVAVLGIVVVHLLSLWTYEHALERERHAVHAVRLADQLAAARRTVAQAGPPSFARPGRRTSSMRP